jgi:miniconductance mechanosensitive channel
VPVKSFTQLLKLIIFIGATIIIVSIFLNKSPWGILQALGALTAVSMLVFKDSILGFVATIQLASHKMVHIGDWIEMPKYGADGDVIDITLNTVKVQNWDKTISCIPTYALVSDGFKNWRGMVESGGRRIKRSFNLDMNSFKFCDEAMLEQFSKIEHIKEYIADKKTEIQEYNDKYSVDLTSIVNGRKMTNIGTFRHYVECYLKNYEKLNHNMTFLIRQLAPTESGLPIEVYVFTNDTNWVNYEGIQGDIFDHILTVVPEFQLKLFQNPSGQDFSRIV